MDLLGQVPVPQGIPLLIPGSHTAGGGRGVDGKGLGLREASLEPGMCT